MAQITIKIRNGIFLQAGEEDIVRRIAKAIVGTDVIVRQYDTEHGGYKWDLAMNTWWADGLSTETKEDRLGRYREIVVAYRYGHNQEELMQAWETVLNFIFS